MPVYAVRAIVPADASWTLEQVKDHLRRVSDTERADLPFAKATRNRETREGELRLSWTTIEADNAWSAAVKAAAVVEAVLPDVFNGAIALGIYTEIQDPASEMRRFEDLP